MARFPGPWCRRCGSKEALRTRGVAARFVDAKPIAPKRGLQIEAPAPAASGFRHTKHGVDLAIVIPQAAVQIVCRPRKPEPGPLQCELTRIRRMLPKQHLEMELPALGQGDGRRRLRHKRKCVVRAGQLQDRICGTTRAGSHRL